MRSCSNNNTICSNDETLNSSYKMYEGMKKKQKKQETLNTLMTTISTYKQASQNLKKSSLVPSMRNTSYLFKLNDNKQRNKVSSAEHGGNFN
jgi:hypothetical protein